MQKSQQTSKEGNLNNIKPISQKKEQLEKGKNDPNEKKDNSKKPDPLSRQKELELKSQLLNKPLILLDFDALSHFKENISHTDKNFLGAVTENSYYCLNCKHSECPLYMKDKNQKDHMIIKRCKCYFYDNNFFNDIEKTINESLTFNQAKDGIKLCIENSINNLKNELDNLKERKFQEIETYFKETDKYLLDLKNKYLNVRQCIEDYYKVNKKFFNIEVNKNTNLNTNNNVSFDLNNKDNKSLTKSEVTINNNYLGQITIEDIENGKPNKDYENAVFILNFELMNLCETKNLEVKNYLKNLKAKIDSFNGKIQTELITDLTLVSGFFDVGIKSEKIEDFYWDVVLRTKKYSELIQQFRETITEIYHNTGNLEKIKDLIDIFDSKLKKNNKIIFEQKYFKDNNTVTTGRQSRGTASPSNDKTLRRRNTSRTHTRGNSKSRLFSPRGKSASKLKKNYNDPRGELVKNNYGTLTLSNDVGLLSLQKNKNDAESSLGAPVLQTHANIEPKKTLANSTVTHNFQNCIPDDIILDQRVIERFFAYSVSELYSKNFLILDPENEDNYTAFNKDNIYLNKFLKENAGFLNKNANNNNNSNKLGRNNSNLKNKRGNSAKKFRSAGVNNQGNNRYNYNNIGTIGSDRNNNNIYNSNNNFGRLDPDKFDSNQYNIKSVSYLAFYTNRYNSLKERAKPLIGTNQIQLFSYVNQKMVKKNTTLNKEEHGYNLFPEGCRHILVEDNLFIIGGTNHIRLPISIVLVYNIVSGSLKRLPDLNTAHSYHTVEYLENYDALLCIGGENSSSCEIMNLGNYKWLKLPSLNTPRANCNVYFNNITGELFALFGICGIICEKNVNYSDAIEVLVISDISQGWLKVDYYKTPGLNLKVNYCMTIPFTRNQLLIYGGSNMRTFRQNIYALFHMIKNECIKVDTQTMEIIKLEEKKSRLVDLALTRLG